MYPSTITLFWRDKTIQNEDGTTTPYPPAEQEVEGFFVEGNAIILVADSESSYLVPLDILDAVSIVRKVEDAPDSGDSDRSESTTEGRLIVPDFGGSDTDSEKTN